MKLKRGDIVLATLPYTDLSGSKKRPALVVQSDRHNTRFDDVILAMITSTTRHSSEPTQVAILLNSLGGKGTGLLHDSVIRCEHLITLHRKLVPRRIGRLATGLMPRVDECLCQALGLRRVASEGRD